MRIGILTSVETRHRYFANALYAQLPVVAVGYEETGYSPAAALPGELSPQEQSTVKHHFAERSRQEGVYFGADVEFVEASAMTAVRHVGVGELNTDATLQFLLGADVDTVVVYGTNLIKSPLLELWPGRMINMHLGLSPYYRGTATNFYPLLNGEPEYVGATIHLIDSGIDSGAILRHARPAIVEDDMPHTIGCKAIRAGIAAMIDVLRSMEAGHEIKAVPQWEVPDARLYLRKDYHPRQVVELYKRIEQGMIRDYVRKTGANARELRLIR